MNDSVKSRMDCRKLAYGELHHPLRFSSDQIERFFPEPLFRELIAHRRFQRLKDIRFLGAIDYAVTANGRPLHVRQTRFDHSVGVGLLAQWLADEAGYADSERFLLVSSALLHDIGHGPLSHSLEVVFKESFSVDHHSTTVAVIRGISEATESISSVLKRYKVDPEAVVDSLSNLSGEHALRLLGKFNLDTLEAIPRSASYLSKQSTSPPPRLVMMAAHFGGPSRRDVLDSFWRQKDFIYQHLINGAIGVQYDRNAQDYMRKNIDAFSANQFYASEVDLRRWHPLLFSRLGQPRWDTVSILSKRFLINKSCEWDDDRYLVVKDPATISFEKRPKELLADDLQNNRLFTDDIQIRRY
jgi:hypothetical protein